VVLSACNRACSGVGSEEGVEALARVFLCAGAQALVVLLWSVGDANTANSCTIFTRN